MHLVCNVCGVKISKEVSRGARANIKSNDGPIVTPGQYIIIDDEISKYSNHIALNRNDLENTKEHPDGIRWSGCCGPDGNNGENILCANGHEVGVVFQDCWTYHCFVATKSSEKSPNIL